MSIKTRGLNAAVTAKCIKNTSNNIKILVLKNARFHRAIKNICLHINSKRTLLPAFMS